MENRLSDICIVLNCSGASSTRWSVDRRSEMTPMISLVAWGVETHHKPRFSQSTATVALKIVIGWLSYYPYIGSVFHQVPVMDGWILGGWWNRIVALISV